MTTSRAARRLVPAGPTGPAALALGLVLTLAAGCGAEEPLTVAEVTGDVSGMFPAPAEPLRPVLEIEGAVPTDLDTLRSSHALDGTSTVADDGTVLVTTDRGVTAYDGRTHKEQWSTALEGGACRVSEVVDGRVAVLLDSVEGSGVCREVGVLDLGTGALRWRQELTAPGQMDDGTVALGAEDVYAGGGCGSVAVFSAASGEPREPLLVGDDVCADVNAMAGGEIALWEDGNMLEDAEEAEELFPYVPDGPGSLRVLDAADGSLRWERMLPEDDSRLNGIVATEPLVLDVTEDDRRSLQRYDADGDVVGRLDLALRPAEQLTVAARSGDVVVLGLDPVRPGYRAYDLTSGEELWRADVLERSLAGGDDRGLVWTEAVQVASPTEVRDETRVLRSAADDPDDTVVLGALPDDADGAGDGTVVGEDLLLAGPSTSTAYALGD